MASARRLAVKLNHLFILALKLTLTCSALSWVGCAASPDHIDDTVALRHSVQEFHKNLRWARYQEAAVMVSPEHRNAFIGRYEELGDEFHITELEVKNVTYEKDEQKRAVAIVETEQQSYKEETMTVKKEKYIEKWRRDRAGWQMLSRQTKKEWRNKNKLKPDDKRQDLEDEDKDEDKDKDEADTVADAPQPSPAG